MKSDVLANNCARKNPSGTITCKLIHIREVAEIKAPRCAEFLFMVFVATSGA